MTAEDNHQQEIDALMQQITEVTDFIGQRNLDKNLEQALNSHIPFGGEKFQALRDSCLRGFAHRWLGQHEAGGIKFGRIFKPSHETAEFSVDVVDMHDIAGPTHTHPLGEIDLIIPLDEDTKFDGRPGGWLVYPPGSQHAPTVTSGRALILYLLPQGSIKFHPRAA